MRRFSTRSGTGIFPSLNGVLLLLGFLLLGAPNALPAETAPKPDSSPTKTTGSPDESSRYLRTTINPSTNHIVVGSVYALEAEFENISQEPVEIDTNSLSLTVQPELAPSNVVCMWSYSPLSNFPSPTLLPGDKLAVFFQTGSNVVLGAFENCKATRKDQLQRQLDFAPGNYAFVLSGIYKIPNPGNDKAAASGTKAQKTRPGNQPASSPGKSAELISHYLTKTEILPVTIDQSQIITYAGIGGLLALCVTYFQERASAPSGAGAAITAKRGFFGSLFLFFAKPIAAILVSATVTIITSRLSTTSFPVQVSVSDFWGALTVGFVSYFVGDKIMAKLAGDGKKPTDYNEQRGAPLRPNEVADETSVRNSGFSVAPQVSGPRDEPGFALRRWLGRGRLGGLFEDLRKERT